MSGLKSDILTQIQNIREHCEIIKPLVVVRCITFNHQKYIRDAIEGFLMQKTDFPYVVIIHDDASTDETTEIIMEYAKRFPDIIFPILEKENIYSKDPTLLRRIMNEASIATGATYIALCEGDDYWTDPLKLQKQVNLLEKNPEVGLCYTGFDIKDEVLGNFRRNLFETEPETFPKEYDSAEDFLIKKGYVAPPSWMCRVSSWEKELPNSVDGTFVRFFDLLWKNKVKLLPDVTCVYRILPESASNSLDYEKVLKRQNKVLKTQFQLIDHYKLSPDLKNKCLEAHYRQYLRSLVINCKHKEVAKAKEVLSSKSAKEHLWFALDLLRLNKILKILKDIKYKSLSRKSQR